MKALQVSDISKKYENTVLNKISFTAEPGDTIAITGPSGSGKSTLLNIIGGLDKPDSGEVMLSGDKITAFENAALSKYRNQTAGFVFQEHFLLPQCTVLENVLLPAIPSKDASVKKKRALNLLKKLGLIAKAASFPEELSGGERQRTAIARAMLNSPKLLLCDEPTGNLDEKNGKKVTEIFLKLAKEENVIVLLVTHNLQLVKKMKIKYRLSSGRLVRC